MKISTHQCKVLVFCIWMVLSLFAFAEEVTSDTNSSTTNGLSVIGRVPAGHPDNFEAQHQRSISQNPPGIAFKLVLTNDRAKFYPGQPIPIEYEFFFSQPAGKQLDLNSPNGIGPSRLLDAFLVNPTNDVSNFYRGHINARSWSGSSPAPVQANQRYRLALDLNEWLRFDAPGKYRVYAQTVRVWPPRTGGRLPDANPFRLTSEPIEFEIVPAPANWAEEQVRQAHEILAAPDEQGSHKAALRRLRFLDTPEAIRELVRHFTTMGNREDAEISYGLNDTRHSQVVAAEMESLLKDPDFPISADFFWRMGRLAFDLQESKNPAAKVADVGGKESPEYWKEQGERQQKFQIAFTEKLLAAYAHKRGDARPQTLDTIWQLLMTRHPLYGGLNIVSSPVFDAWRARLPDEIRGVFDELPSETQIKLISGSWKSLANSKLLPILRRLYAEKPKLPPNYDDRTIHSLMLRRIYELAPEDGKELLLQEIRSTKIRVDRQTLNILPAEPRPDLDEAIFQTLQASIKGARTGADWDVAGALLCRYGSANLLPQVQALCKDDPGIWACSLEATFLTYFLRVQPDYGLLMINRGLDSKQNTKCYQTLIGSIAGQIMTPEFEKLIISRMADPDSHIAASAVAALRNHGLPDAEKFLWQEMQKWQKASQKRKEGGGHMVDGLNMDNLPQMERALAFALAYSPQWVTDKPKLQRLQALCVTDEARRTVGSFLKNWEQQPLRIRLNPGVNDNWRSLRPSQGGGFPPTGNDTWSVAQYACSSLEEFKRKLSQFPPGTIFTFSTQMFADPEEGKALLNNLQSFLETHGMKLLELTQEIN